MRKFFHLSSVSVFLLAFLGGMITSCDETDKEPTPAFDLLHFSDRGGKQTVEIISRDGSPLAYHWQLKKLYAMDLYSGLFPDSTFTYQSETLPDGSMRITSEWTTYTISKDHRFVTVEMAPNTTDKGRGISFYAVGQKRGFFLDCFQRARKPKK